MKKLSKSKKYILYVCLIILIILIFLFLYLFQKKEIEKKSNLYIALKSTGYYDQTQDEKKCELVLDIIFGKDIHGGLNKIYEDVTGKEFPEKRLKCQGKNFTQIMNETKYMERKIAEALFAILKNKNVRKRNNDLVSMLIIIGYGIGRMTCSVELNMKNDGKSLKFRFKQPDGEYVMVTPSTLIQTADNTTTFISNDPDVTQLRNLIKKNADELSDNTEISSLRSNTNPEMTIDMLASILIYQISKMGMFKIV